VNYARGGGNLCEYRVNKGDPGRGEHLPMSQQKKRGEKRKMWGEGSRKISWGKSWLRKETDVLAQRLQERRERRAPRKAKRVSGENGLYLASAHAAGKGLVTKVT